MGYITLSIKTLWIKVEAFATFVLYGAWGMIYNKKFTGNGGSYDLKSILKITDQLFY